MRSALAQGQRLLVVGLDADGAAWLRNLTGKDVALEPFAHDRAFLTRYDPLLRGLTHGDFIWADIAQNKSLDKPLPNAGTNSTGHQRLIGADVQPLLKPSFLGVVKMGEGQIIVDCVRSLDYPLTKSLRGLSQLLTNAGATLNPAGVALDEESSVRMDYYSIDLRAHVNRPYADNPDQPIRGWSAQGPNNDMSTFPLGKQVFNKVPFDIIDPATNGGKSVIALAGATAIGQLPAEVKEIKVGRKADQLIFLHSAAWGPATFFYRIWYAEDRKKWIPTDPDPFVVVPVKPNESISDWYGAQGIADGRTFLPCAQLAWTGFTKESQARNWKVGVYMMTWENPHPEKTIDAIDILAPGAGGAGQPFVLAITGATTAQPETPSPAVPTTRILPQQLKPDQVFRHYQNGTYGVVILKNGAIPVLHDAHGTVLFNNVAGWGVQGGSMGADGKTTSRAVERQATLPPVPIEENRDTDGNPVYTITRAASDHFSWSQCVTCHTNVVRVEYELEITKPFPPGMSTNITTSVSANPAAMSPGKALTGSDALYLVPLQQGLATIHFDPRLRAYWHPGYYVYDRTLTFRLFGKDQRNPGDKDSVFYEIELPVKSS